ncbi:MAG: polysaccharide biosynthesis protein, partial [Planctomycetota bacterium]|nr:polysaccharide biosynthesis protein [Planctomycetota bacterium]
ARAVAAERFVMISTDKAVNPTSVMGATKRLAELYVRSMNSPDARTRFKVVRFGNVLGSACSVLPIWARQIAEGAPVTVTDERMTRYFMTIPEAASLVIQAAALTDDAGAEVFVLDMGEPVRILDLAVRFIEAHGMRPRILDSDESPAPDPSTIDIAFIGARRGEKLHEQLAHAEEELRPTPTAGLLAWRGEPVDHRRITEMISDLAWVRRSPDHASVISAIRRWTTTSTAGTAQIPNRSEPSHAA